MCNKDSNYRSITSIDDLHDKHIRTSQYFHEKIYKHGLDHENANSFTKTLCTHTFAMQSTISSKPANTSTSRRLEITMACVLRGGEPRERTFTSITFQNSLMICEIKGLITLGLWKRHG